MSSVKELHDKAMGFADGGFREKARGDTARSLEFFAQALDAELAAIQELDEPNGLLWSILHRSAGTLALDCRRFRQAEQIVATALAGDPHPEIVEELRDLLEQIYFQRHLDLRGVALTDSELQFSLAGPEVGAGIAERNLVSRRVDNTARLIYRIAERKHGLPFRERGQPSKEIRTKYQLLESVPRSGSFALSLRFGNPNSQSEFSDTPAIIDEFMELIALVNRFRIDAIQEIIPHPDYQLNFFSLAQKIAPDGERVRQVGFTAIRGLNQHSVELTTEAAEIAALLPEPPPPAALPEYPAEPVEINGVLRFADATRDSNNVIQVTPDDQSPVNVTVPPDRMNNIVSRMWDSRVVIQAIRTGNTHRLEDIQLEEEVE